MTLQADNALSAFQWSPQPAAWKLVNALADDFLSRVPAVAALATRMRDETGTRFVDWIDHIRLPRRDARVRELNTVGYHADSDGKGLTIFLNDDGMFPPIVAWDGGFQIAIKVESVADFLAANQLHLEIAGAPLASSRTSQIAESDGCALTVSERHGTRAFDATDDPPGKKIARLVHLERFRTRPRNFETDEEGFAAANALLDSAIADVGRDLACDLWFAAEREFWMRRNHAARVQKARQDRLGLGWANHDHHTYRASRRNFTRLVATWEKLGFVCRERFYAGREAGWGAQVMEQPVTGVITFNDVDLTPDELMGDFSHEGLSERNSLGTVGLWCGLHGDSFLQAGMHHLEAMFDFDALKKQLEDDGVKTMKPFTNFTYLRQAFTEGERWQVDPKRIQKLLDARLITTKQAEQFREQGAIGSHLENLERNDGFKGFNQTGVSEIIAATDPRKNVRA